ncbi:RidA family protein [Leptospira sp. 2 VSF19]|uniref:RidA family protein n=1 Tax=Leptospira soteropolitanensis TaxID=2950025 RepID=A0AAW5VJ38_9LEPT|nr:RidA family protein [Leptospira soteropolitanensis]MCW7492039.1 RidA family protein [Leptospira soteropolitanensis]MCW7499621.1 RidA family protein [Leptospira soteropolitanensis]MCW7521872.1 RidA family protein [Leptospira soteropolitanensis]MCW7525726.1 RidA family protein [Leptospira soteropolitanensis]MCW7530160.1 RidA family protein [Leptospira soteropolitanensis]
MPIHDKLKQLGLEIPPVPAALAAYIPSKRSGNLIFTSGQLPLIGGKLRKTGKVGKDLSLEEAKEEAKQCVLNALAAILLHVESLDKIKSIVKLGVFVSGTSEFTEQHLVANGASELLATIFGEKGKHARFAIGVSSLPLDASVELEMVAEVE